MPPFTLAFDPDRRAVIEPTEHVPALDGADRCVICFFQDVIASLAARGAIRQVAESRSELGPHPVYEFDHGGTRVALFHPGVGAPLAAALLEEAIARGYRRFIGCGSAGVLDSAIVAGHVVVPTAAVRDEGTSYHYLPSEIVARPDAAALAAIIDACRTRDVPHATGVTWTTDAPYRETRGRVASRRAEGCVTVEMEAAAFFAVAAFRGVQLGMLLYGGDDVAGERWDPRGWTSLSDARERLFWLAADAVVRL